MLTIHPIPAFNDNYIWAIINNDTKQAIIVDAGDAAPVLDFLTQHHLSLSQLWITHHHNDHIGGASELAHQFPEAVVYAHANIHPLINVTNLQAVGEGSVLNAWGHNVEVWQTAGHTENHIAYLLTWDNRLNIFCGDTLFRAGCGRVFTGTIDELYASFDRFNELHDADTLFYPAHEYTLSNLKFAQSVAPTNVDIQAAIDSDSQKRAQGLPTLPTSLAEERKINPFMMIIDNPNTTELITQVNAQLPGTGDAPFEVFSALRELKNRF